MHSKAKGILWILAAVLVAAFFGIGLPLFAKFVPWTTEVKISKYVGADEGWKSCTKKNPEATKAFQKIISRIYPLDKDDKEFTIEADLIEGSEVNAFAFLGGKIYVFDGLIKKAESAEELAGVLAHEIGHVKKRHIIQGVFVRLLTSTLFQYLLGGGSQTSGEIAQALLNMKFSRGQEREADVEGLDRLATAHVSVEGFRKFFERMEESNFVPDLISDHPADKDRAGLVQKYEGKPSTPLLSEEEWNQIKSACKSSSKASSN